MTTISRAAAALPGIGLEEIAERASLMTRTDRKYLVPEAVAAALVDALCEDLCVLEIDGARTFAYRSLYYDTPGQASYRTAATRRRRRFKVRRREYVDAGTAFLEVKTRTGRGDTAKVREPEAEEGPAPQPGDPALAGEGLDYALDQLQEAGVPALDGPLYPVLETTYRRTTVLLASEGSRMTIDQDLAWRDETGRRLALEDLVIVETKSAATPGAADRYLWCHGHRPVKISKFATGCALLDPSLPAHRWHRVLRHLAPHVRGLGADAMRPRGVRADRMWADGGGAARSTADGARSTRADGNGAHSIGADGTALQTPAPSTVTDAAAHRSGRLPTLSR